MKIDNLEILNGLIAGAEGGTVEFKETTGQLERGMETLCAFLNGAVRCNRQGKDYRSGSERQDEAQYCGNHQTNRAVCDH